jgi:acetyl esterase/lipase
MKTPIKMLCATLLIAVATSASAYVETGVQKFLDQVNKGKAIETLPVKNARQVLVGLQNSASVDVSGIDVQDKTITVNDKPISLTIVRPAGDNTVLPVFMFFHGGGWILGDYKTHERLVRDLVVNSGAVAVFVNYSPSPEAHYPVAINQAYQATKWVAEHGAEINVDPKRLAVVGNSVGGNMAAVVALMAKKAGNPTIKYQVLLWPVTNDDFDNASFKQFAKGYFLSKPEMMWMWNAYTKNPDDRKEITATPFKATAAQLKGLPPALIITEENDILRDEGEGYAKNLNAAGVEVVSVRYNGTIHDFGLINPLATNATTEAMILQVSAELKKQLQ